MLTFVKNIRQPHAIGYSHSAHCDKVHYVLSPKQLSCVKVRAAQAQIAQYLAQRNNNKDLTDITCQAISVFQFSVNPYPANVENMVSS